MSPPPQHLPMGEQGRGLPWGLLAALLGSPLAGKSWAFSGTFEEEGNLFFGWRRDGTGGEMRILHPLPGTSPRATHRVACLPGGLIIGVLSFCLAVAVWRPWGETVGGSGKPRAAPPQPSPELSITPALFSGTISHISPKSRAKLPVVPHRSCSTRHGCPTGTHGSPQGPHLPWEN